MWVSISPLSGNEFLEAQRAGATATHRVVGWFDKVITSRHRFVFNGRRFNVESVLNPMEAGETFTAMCKEVV